MLRTLFVSCLLLLSGRALLASDVVPGEPQEKPIALVGGTVYPVSGEPIENGVIVFENGKITLVGSLAAVQLEEGTEQIDVTGKRIYPGLFDAANQVGLVEIGAVRAMRDQNEAGSINPNAQAHVSVNPDSEIIPTTRANGVLLSHVLPSGGLISGQGAVIQLDGWTYEDLTLAAPTCIRLNWPNMLPRQAWWIETPIEEQLKARDEQLQAIEDLFDQAERYSQALSAAGLDAAPTALPSTNPTALMEPATRPTDAPAFDARLEAMVPLLDGRIPLLVNANEASQMEAAVAFAKRRGLNLILYGGTDAAKVATLLKDNDIPVILEGIHRLPTRRDEPYDEAFTLPARLVEAGVTFAIASDREPAFVRNLPYHAATAAAFGLTPAQALESITLAPARILGVDSRVGSLEAGKDATLFVADGDILETPTQVTHAWINGRPVDLSSRHTQLYEKYKKRYGQD